MVLDKVEERLDHKTYCAIRTLCEISWVKIRWKDISNITSKPEEQDWTAAKRPATYPKDHRSLAGVLVPGVADEGRDMV